MRKQTNIKTKQDVLETAPRVCRKMLRIHVLQALDEDGIVTLLASRGYGARSLAIECAHYLKARKQTVNLFDFSSVLKSDLQSTLKALLGNVEGATKPYLFLLDFPSLEEDEVLNVLPLIKKVHHKARVCLVGLPTLDLLNDYLAPHTTLFARDLLLSEREASFFYIDKDESYLQFMRSTNGIISLAEKRFQEATRTGRKTNRSKRKDNVKEIDGQGLLKAALDCSLLKEEKEARCILGLLGEGKIDDIRALGLSLTHEKLKDIARDAPIFGISADYMQFSLPENVCAVSHMARYCLEHFESTFFALLSKLLARKRLRRAYAILSETASYPVVKSYILEHAPQLFEAGAAGLVLHMSEDCEAKAGGMTTQTMWLNEFLYITATFSHRRTKRWQLALSARFEEMVREHEGLNSSKDFYSHTSAKKKSDHAKSLHQQKKKSDQRIESERERMQYLLLLYEVAHHYVGLRKRQLLDGALKDTYAALEHFDARFPHSIRALSSFLYIRHAFLHNDFDRALMRAEVARIDCNQTSFSGSLLTLALFELAAAYGKEMLVSSQEAAAAISFLAQPGYESVYRYEKLFLELFGQLVHTEALIADVQSTLSYALERRDDVAVACSFCALSYNALFKGSPEKSLAHAREANHGAQQLHLPLLNELTLVLKEALSSEANKHVRELDAKATKHLGATYGDQIECKHKRIYASALPHDPHEILSLADILLLIIKNTKQKIAYQKRGIRFSHAADERQAEQDGRQVERCERQAEQGERRRKEKALQKSSQPSREEVEISPSFTSTTMALTGLWKGVLFLLIECGGEVAHELMNELPAQWRNALIEKKRVLTISASRNTITAATVPAESAGIGPGIAWSLPGASALADPSHPTSVFTVPPSLLPAAVRGATIASPSLWSGTPQPKVKQELMHSMAKTCITTMHPEFQNESTPFGWSSSPLSNSDNPLPLLEISLLGNFSIKLGGASIPETAWRRESSKNVLVMLAAASGHALSRQTIFQKLWPDVPLDAHMNNLYTALSDLRKTLLIPGQGRPRDTPYLYSKHGEIGLDERYVFIDVDAFYTASKCAISARSSDTEKRLHALDVLTLFGRGPQFPRGFSLLPEADYLKTQLAREFASAAMEGALASWRLGFLRDATKLALAAVAASQLSEEIVSDAMKMLFEMGKIEEVRRIYRVFKNHYKKLYGLEPEGEVAKIYRQLAKKDAMHSVRPEPIGVQQESTKRRGRTKDNSLKRSSIDAAGTLRTEKRVRSKKRKVKTEANNKSTEEVVPASLVA